MAPRPARQAAGLSPMGGRSRSPDVTAGEWTRRMERAVGLWRDGVIDGALLSTAFADSLPAYRAFLADFVAGAFTPVTP